LRVLSASICWRACSTVCPGFSRATYDQLLLWRLSSERSCAVKATGSQTFTSVYWIYQNSFIYFKQGYGAALSIVLLGIILGLSVVHFLLGRRERET